MGDQTQTKTKDKEASGSGLGKTMMSPYFLSASDNPGTIITQVQLRGTNYDEWARAMRTALRAKKKFGFVDGTNTIELNLRSTVTYTEVAKLLWDDIKERFSVGNGPRVQQLKSELANCKQRELSNYEQSPACLCGNCTCNLGAEWDKKRDEERLHQFLMGLDEAVYGGVWSHILSTEPLPKLNRAYAIVIQEEQVQSMTRAKEERSEPVAFAVQAAQGSHDNRDKTSVLCTHCNKTGHEASSCFQLIGYPEWWGERPKATRNAGRVATGSNNPSGELTESAASGLSSLSSEQWNTLLNLLNSKKDSNSRISGKRNSMEWILDTGASHHMTGNRKIVRDSVSVIPCSILLPDGNVTIANTEGTIVLASHLRLNNDHITRMLIGAGEQRGGLYYFRDIGSATALSSVANRACDLWHRRLGHPSSKVVQLLPFIDLASCLSSFQNCDAPSYANIRSFGCLAYAYNRGHRGDKFASRSRRCIFMGYPFGKKGWYLYDLESASFFTSRDVTFVEHDFPYKALTEPTATVMPASERDELVLAEDLSHDLSAPVVSPDLQDTGDVLKTINTLSPVPSSPTFDEHAFDDRGALKLLRYHCNNNRRWGATLDIDNNRLN
ncbi:retrovirus-related pol polyprotein from transposon RE1 [Citrus sinensis]|nr:retrovirus-related pol polyprotein from transposon RE1 [Citrus sinensis]